MDGTTNDDLKLVKICIVRKDVEPEHFSKFGALILYLAAEVEMLKRKEETEVVEVCKQEVLERSIGLFVGDKEHCDEFLEHFCPMSLSRQALNQL